MKGIVTVVGLDKVGIIASVCQGLASLNVNILDINQTITDGYFNMMMVVDLESTSSDIALIDESLKEIGRELGVVIQIQHESIFSSMHRI